MKKLNILVEELLRDHPQTRSSDRMLLLGVVQSYGLNLTPEQKQKFLDLPAFETITRIRRKLQEQGKYEATEPIKRHRKFKSMQVQQAMPKTNPDKVEQLINERPTPVQSTLLDVEPPKQRRYF